MTTLATLPRAPAPLLGARQPSIDLLLGAGAGDWLGHVSSLLTPQPEPRPPSEDGSALWLTVSIVFFAIILLSSMAVPIMEGLVASSDDRAERARIDEIASTILAHAGKETDWQSRMRAYQSSQALRMRQKILKEALLAERAPVPNALAQAKKGAAKGLEKLSDKMQTLFLQEEASAGPSTSPSAQNASSAGASLGFGSFLAVEPALAPSDGGAALRIRLDEAASAARATGGPPRVRFISADRRLDVTVAATRDARHSLVARSPRTDYVGRAGVQVSLGGSAFLGTRLAVRFFDATPVSISPRRALLAGGTHVTVSGRGFVDTGVARVLLHKRRQRYARPSDPTSHWHNATAVHYNETVVDARYVEGGDGREPSLVFTVPACDGACAAAAGVRAVAGGGAAAGRAQFSVHVAVAFMPHGAYEPEWSTVRQGILVYVAPPATYTLSPPSGPASGGGPLVVVGEPRLGRLGAVSLAMHDADHTATCRCVGRAGAPSPDDGAPTTGELYCATVPAWPVGQQPSAPRVSLSIDGGQTFADTGLVYAYVYDGSGAAARSSRTESRYAY